MPQFKSISDQRSAPLVTYKRLEKELGVTRSRLQVEIRELRDMGLVELSPAVDYDYVPNGSGWILTSHGVALINHLADGKDAESFFTTLLA